MPFKDVIIGVGEVGSSLYELFSPVWPTDAIDVIPEKIKRIPGDLAYKVRFLHICLRYDKNFFETVEEKIRSYEPKVGVIIHSTVPPTTGQYLQSKTDVPVISSPVRGMHRNFIQDLKKYTKWYGFNGLYTEESNSAFLSLLYQSGITNVKQMTSGRACEVAKIICDTSYHGWLISYRYMADWICEDLGIHPDEIWQMNQDAPEKPTMYSDKKGIGGHCVMPNLDLITWGVFDSYISKYIKEINQKQIRRYETRN